MYLQVYVELVQFEKGFLADRTFVRLLSFVPQKVIDRLVVENEKLLTNDALMRGIFDMIL